MIRTSAKTFSAFEKFEYVVYENDNYDVIWKLATFKITGDETKATARQQAYDFVNEKIKNHPDRNYSIILVRDIEVFDHKGID